MSLVKQIRTYFESQNGAVTPRDLANNFIQANPLEVADIIMKLTRDGFLKTQYRVVRPNGQTYEGEFDDPRDIPDNTYDSASDIIPVFYRVV